MVNAGQFDPRVASCFLEVDEQQSLTCNKTYLTENVLNVFMRYLAYRDGERLQKGLRRR